MDPVLHLHQLEAVQKDVASLLESVSGWRVGGRYLDAQARSRLETAATAVLTDYHQAHPLEPGAPLQWLRSRLVAPDDVATAMLASLQ